MMGSRARVCIAAVVCLLLSQVPSRALEITVESAGQTQVVSGLAAVTITGVAAADSYVILRAGGRYIAAVGDPFSYTWDTRGWDDGPVSLEATEVSSAGVAVATASAQVHIANSAVVEEPVTLAWKLRAGEVIETTIEGRCDLSDVISRDHKFVPARLFRAVAGTIAGSAADTVSQVTAASVIVNRQLKSLTVDYPDRIVEVTGSGQTTSFAVQADGRIAEGAEPGVVQARAGMLWIALPQKAVRAQDQWTGDAVFIDNAQTGSVRREQGTYELLGFRMWNGEKCALIETRVRYTDDLTISLSTGEEKFPRVRTVLRRLSYFSLDTGRVLRAEETVDRMLSISSADWGISAESFIEPAEQPAGGQGATGGPGAMVGSGPTMGVGPRMGFGGGFAGGAPSAAEQVKIPEDLDLIYRIRTVVEAK